MKVFEISILVFLMEDFKMEDAFHKLGSFIDSGLAKNSELLELHNKNTYKNYCFCLPYPLEKDKVYKAKNNYTIRMRTVDKRLAEFFNQELVNHYDKSIKGLTSTIRIVPKRYIDKIYSITPVVMKTEEGYWKKNISLNEFERRLKINLIKKYNLITKQKIDEDFQLYTSIEFTNKKPAAIKYKERKFLGDKVTLNISDDKMAQELAYFSLGVGVAEINARGAGYVNAKWL